MRFGRIEPMSEQEFDALRRGAPDEADPQAAAVLAWLESGGPFRVTVEPEQHSRDVAREIARLASRHGIHVATVAGDGFVAVRKIDAPADPARSAATPTV
jgi:hypothetical protein